MALTKVKNSVIDRGLDLVSDLVSVKGSSEGELVTVKGYYAVGDGGGGDFYWSATGTTNGGTVFAGSTGFWHRIYSGAVNVKWFGASSTKSDNQDNILEAAKVAVQTRSKILLTDIFKIDQDLNLDTRTSAFNDLDSSIPNGSAKYLSIEGQGSASGIYPVTSAYTGQTTSAITYCAQGEGSIKGVTFRFHQDGATTYSTLRTVRLLHIKGSDRLTIEKCNIGGIQDGTSVLTGCGISLWLEDVMSPTVRDCFIVYYTRYGICRDGGSAEDPIATTETIRVSTSGLFEKTYFGGGWPDATSRDYCLSMNLSYGDTVLQCIFENNNKGRAITFLNDNCSLINNWFEGNYDTIKLGAGFGHTLIGSFAIQYAPSNYCIEGLGTYSIGGVLGISTYVQATLDKTTLLDNGFYSPERARLKGLYATGAIEGTSDIKGGSCAFVENAGDVNGIIGATTYPVINDQATFSIHNPVGGVSRLRFSDTSDPSTTSVYSTDIYTNPVDSNNGLVVYLNQNKRVTFNYQGSDGFYFANSTYGRYFQPGNDNQVKLGDAAYRWSTVYAGTGTINTSDENEKQQITNIEASEKIVALQIKQELKKFKFNDAVSAKGDSARIHIGVIAQEVFKAFADNGLNPSNYAMFCEDTWWVDAEGAPTDIEEDKVKQVTRLGIRYEELLCFIISAM